MWVCLCKGVTDRQICAAIDAGARTTFEVARQSRAGTGCGACLPEVKRLLFEHCGGACAGTQDEGPIDTEQSLTGCFSV